MVGVVLLCVGACGQDESFRARSEHLVRTRATEHESEHALVLTECSDPGPGIRNTSVRQATTSGAPGLTVDRKVRGHTPAHTRQIGHDALLVDCRVDSAGCLHSGYQCGS